MMYVIYFIDEANHASRVDCQSSLEYADSCIRFLIGNKKIVDNKRECGADTHVARYEVYEDDILSLDDKGEVVDFNDPVYVSPWFCVD